jgi:hypothetical protein
VKNAMSAADARQNEHLEPNINVASASAAVFQQPAKPTLPADDYAMTRAAKERVGLGCDSEFQLAQTQHHIYLLKNTSLPYFLVYQTARPLNSAGWTPPPVALESASPIGRLLKFHKIAPDLGSSKSHIQRRISRYVAMGVTQVTDQETSRIWNYFC